MKNRIVLFFLTLFFLAMVCVCGYVRTESMELAPIEFQLVLEGADKTIRYWEDENDCCYVFLPGMVELDQVRLCLNIMGCVEINGERIKNRMTCGRYILDQEYTFSYEQRGVWQEKRIVFVRSANVSTMFIDTDSRSMGHIHQEKGNEESGHLALYTSDGMLNYEGRMDEFKGRGNATWSFGKKPYLVKLSGTADLLGMGAAEKWILLANAYDSSHMRNKVVYDFAKKIGLPYSPDSQWVDVYLNGEYAGLYLLSEKIEMSENRVAIDCGTGSYVVSMEPLERLEGTDELYVTTDAGETLRINAPTKISKMQVSEIDTQWQSVENAILASDGIDSLTGKSYFELIDVDSWARKYLIEEIFANRDGCAISQYFYCVNGEFPIYAGPVWDYDGSMGDSSGVVTNGLIANREYFNEGKRTPWFHSLYRKESFYNRVVEIYETEFLPQLDVLLEKKIPEYMELISIAASLDEIRWSKTEEQSIEVETKFIVNYLTERKDMLTDIWLNNVDYYQVCVNPGYGGKYLYYAVQAGDNLEILTLPEDTQYVHYVWWYDKETNERIDIYDPIYEDKFLYILGQLKEE